MKKILTDFMEIMSPPGGESKAACYLADAARRIANDADISSDTVGNLVVTLPGKGDGYHVARADLSDHSLSGCCRLQRFSLHQWIAGSLPRAAGDRPSS